MKHYFLMVFLQTLSFYVIGQKGNNNLEVLPYVRFDHYPEFSYVLNGRPSTDYINIKGTSFGCDLTYKVPLLANFFLRPGLGFYKYSFNDIDRKNASFGNSESRNINFVSPLLIPYFTDKYWYNSIALNLGIENDFPIFRDCQVRLATDIKNYITFSQSYHLTTNPDGSKNFNKNDTKYYGISLLATAGLIKRFKKISVGPSVIVPIFDGWRTDQAFPQETGKDTRNKFFGGVGFGIVFNYSWNKINHK